MIGNDKRTCYKWIEKEQGETVAVVKSTGSVGCITNYPKM